MDKTKEWFLAHYTLLKDFSTPALTVLGFIITIIIAVSGFRTFQRWRREKIEEKRIDVAIDALALAYEAQFRFSRIRSRIISESECEDDYLAAPHPTTIATNQKGSYAVLKRLQRNGEFFERTERIEPKFMAIFGRETTKIFELLYAARQQIETAAQALFEESRFESEDTSTRERLRKLRTEIHGGEPDEVGQKLSRFEKEIEALCRPIVDQTFGRR